MLIHSSDHSDNPEYLRKRHAFMQSPQLPAKLRAQVSACIPMASMEVILYGDGVVYLPMHLLLPVRGLWVIGDLLELSDETLFAAIARALKAQTGVAFHQKRFVLLMINHCRWELTNQGVPGANLSLTFSCKIEDDEVERISNGLNPRRYDIHFGLQPFDAEALVAAGAHPSLRVMYDLLFPKPIVS